MCLFDNLLRVKSHLSVQSGKMTKKIVCNLNQRF